MDPRSAEALEADESPLVSSSSRVAAEEVLPRSGRRHCRFLLEHKATLVRLSGCLGIAAAVYALVQPSPRLARLAPAEAVELDQCVDTPNWSNGMKDCKFQTLGDDPSLCTETGWTCKGYEARGLCGQGKPKGFAMGPGLNSPEKNCCACKNFKRAESCSKDTGGTCFLSQHCDGWRGAAMCQGGRCLCAEGYCATTSGTCQLASRASFMLREDVNASIEDSAPACTAITSGTCILPTMVCEAYRGPTTCSAGQCACLPGSCTDLAGMCFKSMGLIQAAVMPVAQMGQKFPGPATRTALCVSGGGPRSMSAALGQYRALHKLGLIEKLDLISSVSGGSWASAIVQFADMDLDQLLGPPTNPTLLTLEALDQMPAPFGAVLLNKTSDIALKLRTHHVPYRMLWVKTVGRAFLKPFGLYDLDSFMALDEESVQRIIAANPKYKGSKFMVPKKGRARNLVMGGTLLTPDGFKATADNAYSVQMSPDFSGVPFYPDNVTLNYYPTNIAVEPLERVLIGGGMVESFAWGGPAPPKRNGQKGGPAVQLFAPASPLSLAKAVGISSAAFAGFATQLIGAGENLNPQAYVWPVTSSWHPRPQQALPYQLGDGGNIENTGVLAAIQRGATKIVSMINSDTGLSSTVNFCAPPSGLDLKGKLSSQLAQLFGLMKEADLTIFNTKNQVFPSSEFYPLLCEMQKAKYNGNAPVVKRELEVLANPWWGIGGGRKVTVVFYYLDSAMDFEQSLPQETQSEIHAFASGLSGFPNLKTCFQNFPDLTAYTARQVNLVAALTEWSVLKNADLFKEVLV